MAETDTSKPAMHRWHMPSYLLPVALAHDVLRFPNLIPDTAVPMKSITTRTRSVTCQIGGSLSSPASTLMSPHSPQILNRNLTSPLRSVQQSTRVLPPATRLSSLLTKFCSLATNSTARSLIHTKSVPTGTVFVMTHGTPTDHLGSISTAGSNRSSHPDRSNLFFESQVPTN